MQPHVKNYLEYYSVDQTDIRCENCWMPAVDLHHIQPRSKFGKKTKHLQDDVSNIIALCRQCHQMAHFQIRPYLDKEDLQRIHNQNLKWE